jgi:hypothetical protein
MYRDGVKSSSSDITREQERGTNILEEPPAPNLHSSVLIMEAADPLRQWWLFTTLYEVTSQKTVTFNQLHTAGYNGRSIKSCLCA